MSARNSVVSLSSSAGSTKVETRLVAESKSSLGGGEGAMLHSSSSKDDDLLSTSSDEIETMARRTLGNLPESTKSLASSMKSVKMIESEEEEEEGEKKKKKMNGDLEKGEKGEEENTNIQNEFGVCGWILTILSYILIFFTLPISACMCIKVVQEYERAVIFRLGRLMPGGAKGPGIFFIVPCIDTYRKVDLRVLSFEVPPQEILSKDSVTVAVDAVVYFRISNATISVTNVEDAARSTKLLAQTTLRNILGTKTLAEMLSDREAISHQMQSTLDEATEPWGVKVERVEVKDVRLPVQLQRAMAAEAEAAREARAKVIVAEGEQKASRALKEAAEVIAESPSALQLRYLQTLNSISAEKNSTIIFPFPIDLLSAFLQRSSPKVEEPPPLPKKIRSCCLYKYPDWVQGMVGEGRPPTSGHGHSHGGTMGPPPGGPSTMNTTTTSGRPPLPHSMREAAYQSSAYSMPGSSQPPSQLDPGSLYDWRRSGVTSSSSAAAAPSMGSGGGGGGKRPSVAGGANGNSLLKQAIANRMIKEPQGVTKEETREGKEKEGDEMSTSLVMSAAWYRDDEGKTGYKNREWEKAMKIQKTAVKEREKKRMEESGSTVEEIDEELLKKEGDGESIQSGDSGKSKKEKKEEKKEMERIEKERKKIEKEEKKKEKERLKAEEKEKKEEEKKEKERRKRSESPKGSKIEKAEKEKEKRESKGEEKDGKKEEKKEEVDRSAKPPKDPTKLKKTRSEESGASTTRTMKISDSPRSTTMGERRDSSMSESSRVSALSHKSVKFNDRIQVNEIERNDEEESSSDDEFALMSDQEMRRLRDAAAARAPPPPPSLSAAAAFDEDYGYEHWGDAASGDYVDLDQLPVSVRRAIELEYSSRLASLRRGEGRGDETAGSMTRLHGDGTDSLLSSGFPLLPRSASGYFEDPLRDSYIHAINNEAAKRMEVEREARRREELQLLQMTQQREILQMQERERERERQEETHRQLAPPTGLPSGDMTGSFYDNVQGRMGGNGSTGGESPSKVKSPTGNSELFSYAPRKRQDSELLPARAPDATPAGGGGGASASPTPSLRSADRAAFFASLQQGGEKGTEREPSSSMERAFGEGTPMRIDIMEATPPPEGWSEAEERMRRKFVERFGARKAPVAESEFTRRGSDAESMLSTDSRESVVSATSLRAEPAVRRHFNY